MVNPLPLFGGLPGISLVVINYQWKKKGLDVIMPKDKDSQLVFSSNEDFAVASFIYLHCDNIKDYDKQDIVSNIEFGAIIPLIKDNLFYKRMINFVNKLKLSDKQ